MSWSGQDRRLRHGLVAVAKTLEKPGSQLGVAHFHEAMELRHRGSRFPS